MCPGRLLRFDRGQGTEGVVERRNTDVRRGRRGEESVPLAVIINPACNITSVQTTV